MRKSTTIIAFDQHAATTVAAVVWRVSGRRRCIRCKRAPAITKRWGRQRRARPVQARPVFFTERRIRPNNDAVGARERIWELAGCLGRVSQLPHPGGVIRPLIPLAEQEMPRPLLELYFVAAAFICRSASYAVFACLATYARISSASAADTYFPNRGMPSGARSPSTTTRRKATAS